MATPWQTFGLAAVILCACHGHAFAQSGPVPSRGYVMLGGGYLFTQNDFKDAATTHINAEDGGYEIGYTITGGPSLDAAVGVRVWKRLGLRFGIGRRSTQTEAKVEASVPHPFHFDRPRSVTGDASGLIREELALSLHVAGMFPIGSRLHATVFAGPTWLQNTQGMVTGFTYTDSYPFDTAVFGRAVTSDQSASKVGIGAGAAVSFFVARAIGLTATAQFSQADVSLPGAGGASITVKSGGFGAGLGLVVRY